MLKKKDERITNIACPGWGCHEHCVITAHVVDGRIERTERAILKGPKAELYGICQKGIISAKLPYIPERVRYPLKRVGERGEGKFQEISWEQAMDEIGAKLNEIRDKYGPNSVIINKFPCGYPLMWGAVGALLAIRFAQTFGATFIFDETVDVSCLNAPAMDYGDIMIVPETDASLLYESKFIINWAGNPIGWTMASGTTRILIDAQENGVKIVDIGLIYDTTAAKANQFIPIKAGTDAAMALAMANVLINEGLCDEDFIIKHSVAPFLVREDSGEFLRESDIYSDGDPANYVFWNRVPAKAISIAGHVFDYGEYYPDLMADVIIQGIKCKTAFLKLKEHVAKWTPESQEALTGVSAETVRQLTHEYVENKPSSIFLNLGMRYMNSTAAARAINLLPMLSGNLALRGGQILMGPVGDCAHPVTLGDPLIMFPDGMENARAEVVHMPDLLDSFNNPEGQQYKAWINTFSNPVQNWPDRKLWAEQVFPNMDLIVVNEIRLCDTTNFADYVLPECTIFEREEIICSMRNCIVLNEPAIEPVGESKPPAFIWRELAKRVGLEEYFDKDTEDWLRIRLDTTDPAIAGANPPITLERLREEKVIQLDVPDESHNYFSNLDFKTPSGRIEFYFEKLAKVGHAMGTYVNPQILGHKRAKYPLQFFPGRHRFFMQGQFQELPELRVLAGKVSVVALNPIDAKTRGIVNGDWVEVFNDKGSVRARAHLSEAFPPGMAHLWYSYAAKDYPTNPPTVLSTAVSTKAGEDAMSLEWYKIWKEQCESIGLPLSVTALWPVGFKSNETFWDDLCEVKKMSGDKYNGKISYFS